MHHGNIRVAFISLNVLSKVLLSFLLRTEMLLVFQLSNSTRVSYLCARCKTFALDIAFV